MQKIWVILGFFLVLLLAGAVLVFFPGQTEENPAPQLQTAIKDDLLRVEYPRIGEKISSPLVVRGEARGNWYFEASFPIEVRDASGAVLAQGYAQAQGDWMTTEYVPFESIVLAFPPQTPGSAGSVILHKDNPSGLPENEDQLVIPVVF